MMVALAGVIAIIIGSAMLFIGIFTTGTMGNTFDTVLKPTAASGTLTFTGNVTCGEFVNITAVNGTVARFRFNLTGIDGWNCPVAPASGQTNVSTPLFIQSGLTTTNAAANLSTAINANGTLLATMSSSASTDGLVTTLTYSTTGTAGNAVAVSEAVTNASWAAATLTGGVDGTPAWQTAKDDVNTAFVLIGVLIILGGATALIGSLMTLPGSKGVGR